MAVKRYRPTKKMNFPRDAKKDEKNLKKGRMEIHRTVYLHSLFQLLMHRNLHYRRGYLITGTCCGSWFSMAWELHFNISRFIHTGTFFFIQCNFIHRIILNNKGPYVKLTLLILTSPGFQPLNHNQFTAELKLNLCERDIILKRFAVEETAKELSVSVA